MKDDKYSILVIDDEKSIRRLMQKELTSSRREVVVAGGAAQAIDLIRSHWFDVVVLDLLLPDTTDLDLLIEIRDLSPHTEVIMITGHGDINNAVEAMKLGAYDFIPKPFNLDRIEQVVEKAHQRAQLSRQNLMLRHSSGHDRNPTKFIGNSAAINEIKYLVDKVAPTNLPVLIVGDSGVGKDVVANAIHHQSVRCDSPMIIKNCATLQKDLARSELFGHTKGSFTGADESKEGLLTYAHESSMFLDEIGELSLGVQASLLRLLETQTYRRVGEKDERHVDIRFIFATNRDLVREVEERRFSDAFFHRINVFKITIPSLCERKEDLPLLVDYFLTTLSPNGVPYRIVPKAMDCIMRYHWPGNVRELKNVIERSIILAENDIITERSLPGELVLSTDTSPLAMSLQSVEKSHILRILDFFDGNRQKTADSLGISRKTLYRKLTRFDSRSLSEV